MRLRPRTVQRGLYLPSTSMADLAFLLLVFVAIGGMFSAARGIALRMPDDPAGVPLPPPDTPAIWVKVRSDGSLLLDGTPVPRELGVKAVRARLAPYPDAIVVLGAEPQAAYGDVAEFVATILEERNAAGPPGIARVAIPTRNQVEAYGRAVGRDPFEVVR